MKDGHRAAFICPHVFDNSRPILLVSNEDGEFQFLCGDEHTKAERPRVVGIEHMLDRDRSLQALMDLPNGWYAERKEVGSPWERSEI